MARTHIRQCKRAIRTAAVAGEASQAQVAAARDAALALLQRSVDMRHKQLALIRLLEAVKLRAEINGGIWDYCLGAARAIGTPEELRMLHALRFRTLGEVS